MFITDNQITKRLQFQNSILFNYKEKNYEIKEPKVVIASEIINPEGNLCMFPLIWVTNFETLDKCL